MHRPLSILGRRATVALLILATGTAAGGGAQEPEALEPWTTQDVLDGRIDEYAQYALMRMFAQDPVAGAAASAMLSAVKSLELAGIYLPDQQVPALRARRLGKGWWQLLPGGADAVCVSEPGDEAPLIVFRKEIKSHSYRLDPALRAAWAACRLESAPPRPYVATLPPKQPAVAPPAGQPTRLAVLVLGPGNTPVPGATVHLLVAGTPSAGGTTDSAGSVVFDLEPAIYSLSIEAPASLGGGSTYLAAAVEEGRTNFYTVELGTAVAVKSSDPGPSPDARTLMLPSICARQAAGCAAGCTERSLDAGKACEQDPKCLALESSRYLACVVGCERDALACAVAEG